jgi:hypothetical protein
MGNVKQVTGISDLPEVRLKTLRAGRKSLVEKHVRFPEIERDLLRGHDTLPVIAKRYNLKFATLSYYWKMKVRPRLRALVSLNEQHEISQTGKHINEIWTENLGSVREARAKADYASVSSLLGRGVEVLRLLAEVNKEIKTEGTQQAQPISNQISLIMLPKRGDSYEEMEAMEARLLRGGEGA